ncbi:MAG: capsule biosynthesis protein [Porphyrobacter sp. IPPAS B-1204]|nr:MAG: capsule biosynthesis protein [Porphyrobacter sp. IPPAS B-1204]
MASLAKGWDIQMRVIKALMLRELTTRFGRENIGFLWIMAEPLLFAVLVALLWRAMKGPLEYGVDIVAFVISGYIPLVLFRSSVQRAVNSFTANGGLMYHRQINVIDLILVRFLIEFIGHMMAYLFIALVLGTLGFFPIPHDIGFLMLGWSYYAAFTFAVVLVVAPLSEMSDVFEKIVGVSTYLMIPFSGGFYLVGSLYPDAAAVVLWSPPVHGMEMMRYGIFGPSVDPQYDFLYPLLFIVPCMALGLVLCRNVRRHLVIE